MECGQGKIPNLSLLNSIEISISFTLLHSYIQRNPSYGFSKTCEGGR